MVEKKESYYWVDQDLVPIDRLKKIRVNEIEEKQDLLQKKMDELNRDKDILVRLV